MKVYAAKQPILDLDQLQKYVGTDYWIALDSTKIPGWYTYTNIIEVREYAVVSEGIDNYTLKALEDGYISKDIYDDLKQRFSLTTPKTRSRLQFTTTFNRVHHPIEVLTTEELQELLDACEVYEE